MGISMPAGSGGIAIPLMVRALAWRWPDQKDHRMGRDPFLSSNETHAFGRCGFHAYGGGLNVESLRDGLDHLWDIRGEARPLGEDRGIQVPHFPASIFDHEHGFFQQLKAGDPLELGV